MSLFGNEGNFEIDAMKETITNIADDGSKHLNALGSFIMHHMRSR